MDDLRIALGNTDDLAFEYRHSANQHPIALKLAAIDLTEHMQVQDHLRTTGSALKNWFIATLQDAAAVGVMWLIGLLILRVPLAFVWAIIGGACQFIPNFGPVIAVIGPALTTLFTSESDALMHLLYVFMLYAIIAVVDGLALQPYLMKRSNKVPIWASILAPIVLGLVIPFWGVLLAPPLLAVIYAYRGKRLRESSPR